MPEYKDVDFKAFWFLKMKGWRMIQFENDTVL